MIEIYNGSVSTYMFLLTCFFLLLRLNYKTNLLNNITNMNADVVNIFNETVMHGEKGVVKTIKMPKMEGIIIYFSMFFFNYTNCGIGVRSYVV